MRATACAGLLFALLLAESAAAQSHSTPIAERNGVNRVARANADQDSVTVINSTTNLPIDLDPGPGIARKVGSNPRTLAFLPSGNKLYVANMRGEGGTFPNQVFGSVTVLDPNAGYAVLTTITNGIGVEPFGVAAAPDGGFVAVTNFRSHSVSFINPSTDSVTFVYQYVADPNLPGVDQATLDADLDGQPDHANPRGIAVIPSSQAVYVTHFLSGHVTKLALQRQGGTTGPVIGATLVKDINLNNYAPPVNGGGQPIFVTENKSQGKAVNLESITIDPTGLRAWVPHTLLNFRVLVEATPYSTANQGYPAVSIIDMQTDTFQVGSPSKTDNSDRIEFDPAVPAGEVRNLGLGVKGTGGIAPNLDVQAQTHPGGFTDLRLYNVRGAASGLLFVGLGTQEASAKGGKLYTLPIIAMLPIAVNGTPGAAGAGELHVGAALPDAPSLVGTEISLQAVMSDPAGPQGFSFSNGAVIVLGEDQPVVPASRFGLRVAEPVQVEFSADGTRALVINHASEDIAVFAVSGASAPVFQAVWPDRDFVRVPFGAGQPLGENPNGIALLNLSPGVDRLFISNATSQDVTVVPFATATSSFGHNTLRLDAAPDDTFTPAERSGREMFMDATRLQTASNFNGTCTMCHADGLQDGLTWQFAEGPRRTISLAGGPMNFGLIFFKSKATDMTTFAGGFRIHHGGNGSFTPADFAGFTTWTNTRVPLPLNPRKIGGPTASEQRGKDLFFGTNDFGSNPELRSANCAECHPAPNFTFDVLFDPLDKCASLLEANANMRDVGSTDTDGILSDDVTFTFTEEGCVDGSNQLTTFSRTRELFGTPTKLGAFAIAPYFHQGAALNLRGTLDPTAVGMPVQFADTAHDLRGFIVATTLLTPPSQQDIEDVLAFISSL